MIRRSAALFIVLGLATAACASDDATPATPATTAIDPATTVPATDAPQTTPAPTTAPPTTTTVAPTTTLDPVAEIEAAVKQARLDREAAYFAAASDPSNSELREVYRATHTAESFVDREVFLDKLVADRTSLRANTDLATQITFPSPVEAMSATQASIQICRIDSDVIRIPATVSSPEIIVDDRISTTLTKTTFKLVEGRWLVDGGEFIERWEGNVSCES
jgi:hypothetical protein